MSRGRPQVAGDTTPDSRDPSWSEEAAPEPGLALAIVWCRAEPERVGEIARLPSDGSAIVIGRSYEPPPARQGARARFFRELPAGREERPPLSSERLSRAQLTARVLGPRRVAIDNLGRRVLRYGGRETTHVVLKPGETIEVDGELVLLVIHRAEPRSGGPAAHRFGEADAEGIAGESPAAWALREAITFAARHGGHVLASGGRGVGKELALRAVHRLSGARPEALMARSVPALIDDRLGRELFGERSADGTRHAGVLEQSAGGALLLDDLDRATPALGGYLARFLETGELFAIGDPRPSRPDVRIFATAEDLDRVLPSLRARFRHVITIPPLSERLEDLPLIARARLDLILAHHPTLAQRFRGDDAHARVHPSWVQALLGADLVHGIRDIDTFIWRALATSERDRLEAAPVAASRRAAEPTERATARVLPEDLPPSVARGLADLTPTERVVLSELSANKTSRQIAAALFVSLRTVQNHRARICEKLGLRGPNRLLEVALSLADYLGAPAE